MQNNIIYGTYPLQGAALNVAVQDAVKAGFRAFDTAQLYGNESDLGAALRQSGLHRDQFEVTTKIAPFNYGDRNFLSSLRDSIARIGMDYVDTVLLHFPDNDDNVVRLIQRLALAVDEGLVRSIGISNFSPSQMRQAAAVSPIPLRFNQIEFHPLIDSTRLLESSIDTGIALQAFSPLARGAVFQTINGGQTLQEIAQAHGKTAAQVALRWVTQQGLSVVTQTSRPSHMTANLASNDFELTPDELQRIQSLASRNLRLISRDSVKWAPVWD